MNRTMTGMLLVMSCLFAGGVLAQGVQEHPQPSTATTTAGAKALHWNRCDGYRARFSRARTKRDPKGAREAAESPQQEERFTSERCQNTRDVVVYWRSLTDNLPRRGGTDDCLPHFYSGAE